MNYVLGNPLKAKTFSELNVQEYEESSGRETTSFSYFSVKMPSLFSFESWWHHWGTGEIVLTRLSLKTNWLLVLCSSEREGRLQVSVSVSWRVHLKRQPPTDRRPRGRRWGFGVGPDGNLLEEEDCPKNFSASSSFSSSILGREAGARLFQKLGYIF